MKRLAWHWRHQRALSRVFWASMDYRRRRTPRNERRWNDRVRLLHQIEAGRP